MKGINIFIIITLILFIIGITILTIFLIRKKPTPSGTPTPSKPYCQQYPDDPKCGKTIKCDILNPKLIKDCSKDSNICANCQCTDDPTKKLGCLGCQEIKESDNFLIAVSKDQCTDPFQWIPGVNGLTGTCILKPGSYCLPVKINDIPCNPYTGNKTLVMTDTNQYNYQCICKDSTAFVNYPNEFGDCVGVQLCGIGGQLNATGINAPGRKLVYWNDKTLLWDGSKLPGTTGAFDPVLEGACICNENESGNTLKCDRTSNDYVNCKANLVCNPSGCGIFGPDPGGDPNKCNCKNLKGTVNCYDITYRTDNFITYDLGICKYPGCITDPCYRNDGNYNNFYDTENFKCVCDSSKNFYPVLNEDENGNLLPTCRQLCVNNGPCGDRGNCFIPQKSNITNWYFDIYVGTGTNNSYFYIQNLTNNYWLTTDGSSLSLSTSLPSNEFGFVVGVPSQTSNQNISYLTNNSNYILQIVDIANNTILGFVNFETLKIDTQRGNDSNSIYQFSFNTIDDSKSSNKGSINFINSNNIQTYLSADSNNNLTSYQNLSTKELCICCKSPYTQDSNLLCNTLLTPNQGYCSGDDCQCASGMCYTSFLGGNYCHDNGGYGSGNIGGISQSQFSTSNCVDGSPGCVDCKSYGDFARGIYDHTTCGV